jgi:hypothetical protein
MVKTIKAHFIASDDAAFGGGTEDNVYVLAPDLTMSVYEEGHSLVFRNPLKPIGENDETTLIDLGTCARTEVFIESPVDVLPIDSLNSLRFIDVIKALLKN